MGEESTTRRQLTSAMHTTPNFFSFPSETSTEATTQYSTSTQGHSRPQIENLEPDRKVTEIEDHSAAEPSGGTQA